MAEVEKQIAVLYNGSGEQDSESMMKYMIARTLRNHQETEEDGKVYFAIDYKEIVDFTEEPAADVLLFENIGSREAVKEAQRLVSRANKGARIFVPLGTDFITKDMIGLTQTIFTYSLTDQSANVCTNRIQNMPDGTFNCDLVYQATPAGKKRGLRDRIFPTYNQNMFGKARVNSTQREDILGIVKAYAFLMALSVETKYVSESLSSYVFPSFRAKREAEAQNTVSERVITREKEFDED